MIYIFIDILLIMSSRVFLFYCSFEMYQTLTSLIFMIRPMIGYLCFFRKNRKYSDGIFILSYFIIYIFNFILFPIESNNYLFTRDLIFILCLFVNYFFIYKRINKYVDFDEFNNLDKRKVIYCFKKPVTVLEYIISLGFLPASSFAVICDNHIYFFKKNLKGFQKRNIYEVRLDKYLFKESKIIHNDKIIRKLNKKVGSEYHVVKNNCVSVYKGILPIKGIFPSLIK